MQSSACTVHYKLIPKSLEDFGSIVMEILGECGWAPDQIKSQHGRVACQVISIADDQQELIVELSQDLIDVNDPCQWYRTMTQPLQSSRLSEGKILNIHLNGKIQKEKNSSPMSIRDLRNTWNTGSRILSSFQLSSEREIKNEREESYLSWMGGIDIVRESPYGIRNAEFQQKLEALNLERINCESRTGSRKVYIPDISDSSITSMHENIRICQEHRLEAIQMNLDSLGIAASIDLIKTAHKLGLIVFGNIQSQTSALSTNAQLRWWRVLGVDVICNLGKEKLNELSNLKKSEIHNGNPVIMLGPDNQPGNIESRIKSLGYDHIIEARDAVIHHPYGIKAGAEAITYALDCARRGISKTEALEGNENFKRAIREWDSEYVQHEWEDTKPLSRAF